jgi:potassium transporter
VAMIVFITTCLVSLIAIIVWRIHPLVVFPIFLVFACLDSLYLSSALTKIPDGAWFTLLIALLLTFLVYIWRYGKESQHDDLVDRNSRPRWADPRLLVIQGRLLLCSAVELGWIPLLTSNLCFQESGFSSRKPESDLTD